MEKQLFGGNWTEEKLVRVKKYLTAYTTIMKKQPFRFAYIDAFAGTGYRNLKQESNPTDLMFPEFSEHEPQLFLKGSAQIALETEPRFDTYIFIEKEESRFEDLKILREAYPKDDILLINDDCNVYLQELCLKRNWTKNRAVLFLDPFGMQVQWQTIVAIAQTKAIDLWLLFPLGVAVNRLLKKDGNIDPVIQQKLTLLFGTDDWYDAFYEKQTVRNLFGEESRIKKVTSFDGIRRYFVQRLKLIFSAVADNPLALTNSKNVPLYLLCFASGNPKGSTTAVKIAQYILNQ